MKICKFSINESTFTFCIRRKQKGRTLCDFNLGAKYNFMNDFVTKNAINYTFGQIIPTIAHTHLMRIYEYHF
jgi:hypothetical protein